MCGNPFVYSYRSLLASALRRKHFFKDVIRIEAVSSSGPLDSGKPWSADWLNWDPISSGEGDLLLDDMAKSFSSSSNVSKNVKAIDFGSVIDNMPSQGFQVKDLIFGTKAAASRSPAEVNNIPSTTKSVQLSITTNQVSEKSNKLDILPDTEKGLLDDTQSEHPTSLFGDSQKLYLASDATKTSIDSDEVVTKTTTTEEEPDVHNGSDFVFGSDEPESEDLHSDNCIPGCEKNIMLLNENVRIEASGNELKSVMPNENVVSQTSPMDIEPDAACNATAVVISPPSKDTSLSPTQHKKSKSSKCSCIHSDEVTIKVNDVAVDMLIDVEHQENTSLSLNTVSTIEEISEKISLRDPGDDAVVVDQILFPKADDGVDIKDDSLVEKHENPAELVMEEQMCAEVDGKMKDPAIVLSDESLHENALKREPATLPEDDGNLVPESNAHVKGRNMPSTTISWST